MISIRNITKKYGSFTALNNVSIEIFPDKILAVLGPSGCGKTTLLRVLAGLEKPDRGSVTIDNIEVTTPNWITPPSQRGLAMIFQDLALWPHMTVWGNVEFVMNRGNNKQEIINEKIEYIFKEINLKNTKKKYPHQLSGGEKQRLALARALGMESKYLLMDEPFSNSDPILKKELQELIIRVKKKHKVGIIYVTHNTDEAIFLANRIAIMKDGKVEQIDSKERIVAYPKNDLVKSFLGM